MTDTETLDAIWTALNGSEWDSDLWDTVSALVLTARPNPFASPVADLSGRGE